MRERILEQLHRIEATENIKILWAIESGSRAWGFASPDSDYDVRFIYVRKKQDYLRLNPPRDVIELPIDDELDINGWDLQKALRLLYKSNPTLFEWLSSPIVYMDNGFKDSIDGTVKRYFSKKRSLYHYVSTAENNYRKYLQSDMVKAKKYFYVLRPLLACRWILECETAPPILFDELVEAELPMKLTAEVERLLALKINSPEVKEIPAVEVLNEYLKKSIAEIRELVRNLDDRQAPSWDELNQVFLNELEINW